MAKERDEEFRGKENNALKTRCMDDHKGKARGRTALAEVKGICSGVMGNEVGVAGGHARWDRCGRDFSGKQTLSQSLCI